MSGYAGKLGTDRRPDEQTTLISQDYPFTGLQIKTVRYRNAS